MFLKFDQLNYLAILVAGLAGFFLGGMWYMALFGKLWVKLHGWSEEKIKQMQSRVPPLLFFAGMILAYLLSALVVALLVVTLDLKEPQQGLLLGLALWAMVAALAFTGQLASDNHYGIFAIEAGFFLVLLIFQGLLLSWWR